MCDDVYPLIENDFPPRVILFRLPIPFIRRYALFFLNGHLEFLLSKWV
jgi:hypothetical protein